MNSCAKSEVKIECAKHILNRTDKYHLQAESRGQVTFVISGILLGLLLNRIDVSRMCKHPASILAYGSLVLLVLAILFSLLVVLPQFHRKLISKASLGERLFRVQEIPLLDREKYSKAFSSLEEEQIIQEYALTIWIVARFTEWQLRQLRFSTAFLIAGIVLFGFSVLFW